MDETTTDNQETTTTPTTSNLGVDNINPTTEENSNKNTNENSNDTPKDKSTETKDKPFEMPPFIEVYGYDPYGYYIRIDHADKSPLDDTYLKPANSTEKKPPTEVKEGYIPKFNESKNEWETVLIPQNPNDNDEDEPLNEQIRNLKIKNNELMNQLNELKGEVKELKRTFNALVLTKIKIG